MPINFDIDSPCSNYVKSTAFSVLMKNIFMVFKYSQLCGQGKTRKFFFNLTNKLRQSGCKPNLFKVAKSTEGKYAQNEMSYQSIIYNLILESLLSKYFLNSAETKSNQDQMVALIKIIELAKELD